MDKDTLEIVIDKLKDATNYLKNNKKDSACIDGMELATQLVFNMLADE